MNRKKALAFLIAATVMMSNIPSFASFAEGLENISVEQSGESSEVKTEEVKETEKQEEIKEVEYIKLKPVLKSNIATLKEPYLEIEGMIDEDGNDLWPKIVEDFSTGSSGWGASMSRTDGKNERENSLGFNLRTAENRIYFYQFGTEHMERILPSENHVAEYNFSLKLYKYESSKVTSKYDLETIVFNLDMGEDNTSESEVPVTPESPEELTQIQLLWEKIYNLKLDFNQREYDLIVEIIDELPSGMDKTNLQNQYTHMYNFVRVIDNLILDFMSDPTEELYYKIENLVSDFPYPGQIKDEFTTNLEYLYHMSGDSTDVPDVDPIIEESLSKAEYIIAELEKINSGTTLLTFEDVDNLKNILESIEIELPEVFEAKELLNDLILKVDNALEKMDLFAENMPYLEYGDEARTALDELPESAIKTDLERVYDELVIKRYALGNVVFAEIYKDKATYQKALELTNNLPESDFKNDLLSRLAVLRELFDFGLPFSELNIDLDKTEISLNDTKIKLIVRNEDSLDISDFIRYNWNKLNSEFNMRAIYRFISGEEDSLDLLITQDCELEFIRLAQEGVYEVALEIDGRLSNWVEISVVENVDEEPVTPEVPSDSNDDSDNNSGDKDDESKDEEVNEPSKPEVPSTPPSSGGSSSGGSSSSGGGGGSTAPSNQTMNRADRVNTVQRIEKLVENIELPKEAQEKVKELQTKLESASNRVEFVKIFAEIQNVIVSNSESNTKGSEFASSFYTKLMNLLK